MSKQYETVIGLEVHVELATKTKIFCGCSTAFGAAPNTQVCPVCTGMPGTLPVLNKKVVELAIAVGLATNCSITEKTKFDRKNYFYPDNPQSYQISQLYLPICQDGFVEIETAEKERKSIRIHEIHMEEDAGKLTHDEETGESLVDYNRAGVPLIEIVSEPDMGSAEEVIAYLEKLREIIQYLDASDCKLQEGSMRADVNISVREAGQQVFGTRTEMKNLNSFRSITRAIEEESKRQIALIEAGEEVVQETRRWDEHENCSYPMRSKEDAMDYRYFPEPDLVPLLISSEWVKEIKMRQPEMREEKIKRYITEYHLPEYDAGVLTMEKGLTELFEKTTAICRKPKKVSNWLMVEAMRLMREHSVEAHQIIIAPKHLASLIEMTEEGKITGTIAKEVFEVMFMQNADPVQYVEHHGLGVNNDASELEQMIKAVMEQHPKSVADYYGGKKQAMGFLVGQTMKASGGKANPGLVKKLLQTILCDEWS